MKKLPLVFTLLLASILAFTQNINNQKAINDQVWKPFIHNFNIGNADGFMSVHSKDLVRVPRDAKTLSDFSQYKKQIEGSGKSSKRTIELRFTERIATDTKASEAGIYKTTFVTPQGETKTLYGKIPRHPPQGKRHLEDPRRYRHLRRRNRQRRSLPRRPTHLKKIPGTASGFLLPRPPKLAPA